MDDHLPSTPIGNTILKRVMTSPSLRWIQRMIVSFLPSPQVKNKSIPIRCVKCQSIWHTKHQKPLISGILNAQIFGMDEYCNLKIGSVLFTNCKTFIIFLFANEPKQMWEFFFFFFLINSSLYPLSSHTSETLSPVYLHLSLFTLILFLSHPQSTPPTSSHCRAANLA